jgi:solute carrier family 25 oxoglutarate transporter 11
MSSLALPSLFDIKFDSPVLAAAKPFLIGSAAGSFATICIQPMDMVKTRIQLSAATGGVTNPVKIGSQLLRDEGFSGLYSGLSAGLLRQVVYTGSRLGLYDMFTDVARSVRPHPHAHRTYIARTSPPARPYPPLLQAPNEPLPMYKTAACAIAAGGIAAVMGNPADLSLIRMQTDSLLPKAEQRGYTSVSHALRSIVRGEGVVGLFKGAAPTATRAMGLNLGMLCGNTEAKKQLKGLGLSGQPLVLCASAVAGFFASAFSLPFDFVKTMMQNQKADMHGRLPYKSSLDCVVKTLAEGGAMRFYAGFPTFYARIAPHAMITLIAQDQLKKGWAKLESSARCNRATEETRQAKSRLQPTITEMDRGETRNF